MDDPRKLRNHIDFVTRHVSVFYQNVAFLFLIHLCFRSNKFDTNEVFNRLSNKIILVFSI